MSDAPNAPLTLIGVSGAAFRAAARLIGPWLATADGGPGHRLWTERDWAAADWANGPVAGRALYLRPDSLEAMLVFAAVANEDGRADAAASAMAVLDFDRYARLFPTIALSRVFEDREAARRACHDALTREPPIVADDALPDTGILASLAELAAVSIDTPARLLAQMEAPLTAPPPLAVGEFHYAGAHGRAVSFLRSGWHPGEAWGVWSGKRPRLTLAGKAAGHDLLLRTHRIAEPDRLRVSVNGSAVAAVAERPEEPVLRVRLPPRRADRLDVVFHCPWARPPGQWGKHGDDTRAIGFGLFGLTLVPPSGAEITPPRGAVPARAWEAPGGAPVPIPDAIVAWLARSPARTVLLAGDAAAWAGALGARPGVEALVLDPAAPVERLAGELSGHLVDAVILDMPDNREATRSALDLVAGHLHDTGRIAVRLTEAVTDHGSGGEMLLARDEEDYLFGFDGDWMTLMPRARLAAARDEG